jgi:Zn-dependent M28 family amino/carboxypeptidase
MKAFVGSGLMFLLLAIGCAQNKPAAQTAALAEEPKQAAPAPSKAPASPAPTVNSARAMQYVKDIVAIGRRAPGSPGHKREQSYIDNHLKGETVEHDSFTAKTPAGEFPLDNIIAKYPGNKDCIVVVGSHYDTNYPLKDYVGANDGGSTTGMLLELANHLRGKKRDGCSVWLAWFDGEEAFQTWSATDSLYGSKHLAEKWKSDGSARKIRALILLDMIGDADLNVDRDDNSDPKLLDLIHDAAAQLGDQSFFFARELAIEDDHIPFKNVGIPVADLIDYDYGYNNSFHHTSEDTLDKLSPKSLQIIGDVVLATIQRLDAQ